MPVVEEATQDDRGNKPGASGGEGVSALEGAVGAASAFNNFRDTVEAVAARVLEIQGEIETQRDEALVQIRQEADLAKHRIQEVRDNAIEAVRNAKPGNINPVGPDDTSEALTQQASEPRRPASSGEIE